MTEPLFDGTIGPDEQFPDGTWRLAQIAGDDAWHVIPVKDLIPHTLADGCVCRPGRALNEHGMWIVDHHALDGRE